jgi:hypothetical protein
MTDESVNTGIRTINPVQGLNDYIEDIKPYHTKVIESIVEYNTSEELSVIISDELTIEVEDAP